MVGSNDQVAFLSQLNLSASDSSRTHPICRKPAVSITVLEDDALSLRPKRRFCGSGGDTGTDQLHVLGLLRRLLAVAISSPLGKRMIQYVETNLPCVGSCLNPCTVAHTLFGTNGTLEYGVFCRRVRKTALSDLSHVRQFPVRFRADGTFRYCHQYCFSRADRREFCKRYDTGLCSRSRRLKKRFGNSCVSLYQLTPEEIDDWRTSQRLREVVEKPHPVFYINLIDSDESESDDQVEKQEVRHFPLSTSASSLVVPKTPASAASAKRPASKTQPTILKRHKNTDASILNTSVITVSSDSEDDEPDLDNTYTFHCHRCSAKFTCGAQFNEMVESHYRIEHDIHNVNLQCHTAPNGDMSLSVVQSSETLANSKTALPSLRSQVAESVPHDDLQLWKPHRLAFVNGIKPSNSGASLPSATATKAWAFSVPTNGMHSAVISLKMATTSSVVPVTSDATVLICQDPLASSSLLSISRMRGTENAVVTQSAAASLNNCSRSLIHSVSSPAPTLCEPDVICLD